MDEVSVVRSNSEAFSRMDVDAMLEHYAPDAVVVDRRRVSIGTFVGHDELRPYYLSIFHSASELFEDMRILAHRGELVVADCEIRGRLANAPASAPDVTVPYGLAITVTDGKIRRLELYETGEHALDAALGPSER